jgi:hypothetical protein
MAENKKEKKEKPLEKWTIKELRDEALKIPDIQGVHGLNKEELLEIIRDQRGIAKPEKKKTGSVRELKAKVVELREYREKLRQEGASRARLDQLRRKISRIKKQTRL